MMVPGCPSDLPAAGDVHDENVAIRAEAPSEDDLATVRRPTGSRVVTRVPGQLGNRPAADICNEDVPTARRTSGESDPAAVWRPTRERVVAGAADQLSAPLRSLDPASRCHEHRYDLW